MSVDHIHPGDEPYMQPNSLRLRNYLPSELKRLSVLRVTQTRAFDSIGQIVTDGLYDARMGPCEQRDHCLTCGQVEMYCPGHIGHIELVVPVFNPVLYNFTLKLMKGTCVHCHRLSVGSSSLQTRTFLCRLRCVELAVPEVIEQLEGCVMEMCNIVDLGNEKNVSFMELLDTRISEITGKTVKELEAAASRTLPHKVLVDLKNGIIKEFCKLLFKREKTCRMCRERNGSIINDAHRCILIDFSTATTRARSKNATSKELISPEGFEEELEPEDKEEKKDDSSTAVVGDATRTGEDSLRQQLRAVCNGTCDKLAWRGAEVREHFRILWKNESDLLKKCFPMFDDESEGCPLDGLFCEMVLVPPNKFRPIRMFKGERYENPQTVSLRRLLEADEIIKAVSLLMSGKAGTRQQELQDFLVRSKIKGATLNGKMHAAYLNLQNKMNLIFDQELDKSLDTKMVVPGIKQILEKKQGLFRMHMMGKRVNFACRSVITPDPYLDVDEIGIPEVFAKKLTFTEPVNQLNLQKMREFVQRGPDEYPGANFVLMSNGQRKILAGDNEPERNALAKQLRLADANKLSAPMKVLRHVKKGDLLVMNRQPSLHKPSMMGHRARILRGQRALRMNYAPCKAYNADFDGDEMNGHLTQSYLAQCEVGEIANVGNNFLVPKDASPLLGLIQDHVVSGVLLTVRGRMLNKEDFMHLVLAAFAETPQRLKIPPPCMIKPKMLWSGKQVISAIILNCIPDGSTPLNLTSTAKTAVKCWKVRGFPTPTKDQIGMTESEVIFRAGELMCGVLDKSHYGAAQFGLVHCCFELYGHRIGIRILSCFSRLFTTYLQFHGFTLGVADILCLPEADKRRRQAIKGSRKIGNKVVITTFGLDEKASDSEIKHVLAATYCNPKGIGGDVAALDRGMKQALLPFNEEINKACVPDGLIRLFPQNGLQMMIESGAKGSTVNAMQISCALGQIELEGKRMATTIAGRTLPSFRAFDPSPRAGGYIDQRFLTGINPQELFFHTMAGREGLIDTAVKTSRSGYLQRCIIKHLEGIRVHYDATCRDHDGSVIQFRYGEDGMDVCTSSFLEKKQFEFLRQNLKAVEEVSKPKGLSDRNFNVSAAEEHYEKVKKYRRKLEKRGLHSKSKNAGFLAFSEQYTGAPKAEVVRLWQEMGEEDKKVYVKKVGLKQVDAVDERFNPWRTLGALPEKMLDDLDNYCRNLDEKAQKVLARSRGKNVPLRKHEIELQQAEKLKRILFWKGVHSLAAPGENVGLLAAQSIGEPSTQMTLNTFHFAGRGEMNVTLGIPRLREILMTAGKNISTPMAEVKLDPSASEADIERARKILDRIYLKQVIKKFSVDERVNLRNGDSWHRYVLRIELLEKNKREREAQHLSNKYILEKKIKKQKKQTRFEIESTSSGSTSKIFGKEVHEGETGFRGFVQTLDRVVKKKMDEIEKQIAMHIKRVRTANEGGHSDNGPRKRGALAADGESSDEEADGGADADAGEKRLNQRHRDDAAEYEGEEEDREAVKDNVEEVEQDEDENEEQEAGGGSDIEDGESNKLSQQQKVKQDEERIRRVIGVSSRVFGYEFDTKKNSWCEITFTLPLNRKSKVDLGAIAEKIVDSFIVHETPGIEKCIYDPEKRILSTQGVNREALVNLGPVLNMNTFYSNDVNYLLENYGVEACARSIVHEMSSVFEVYGIRPSKRHLTLTADYMTFTGCIQPFNRGAMASSASPLQKMTFETTVAFMREALIAGEVDSLSSPSSRIVVGGLSRGGTGAFDLFLDTDAVLQQ